MKIVFLRKKNQKINKPGRGPNKSESDGWEGGEVGNFFQKKLSGAPDYSGPYLSKNSYFNKQRARRLTSNTEIAKMQKLDRKEYHKYKKKGKFQVAADPQ